MAKLSKCRTELESLKTLTEKEINQQMALFETHFVAYTDNSNALDVQTSRSKFMETMKEINKAFLNKSGTVTKISWLPEIVLPPEKKEIKELVYLWDRKKQDWKLEK